MPVVRKVEQIELIGVLPIKASCHVTVEDLPGILAVTSEEDMPVRKYVPRVGKFEEQDVISTSNSEYRHIEIGFRFCAVCRVYVYTVLGNGSKPVIDRTLLIEDRLKAIGCPGIAQA